MSEIIFIDQKHWG